MIRPPHVPLDFRRLPEAQMRERAQAFYEDIRRRRTVREFSAEPVPREIIEQAILSAGTAPSGANQQPWHFAVIESAALKKRVREAAEEEERAFYNGRAPQEWLDALAPLGTDEHKPFLETAPYLIAVFAIKSGPRPDGSMVKHYYVPESVGIASGLLIAALHHSGLATLTHTPSPMNFLNDICARPAWEKPTLLVVAGYPAPGCEVPLHATRKKSLQDISSWL
ncbi:MAG: Coenzyme F420:L-glutamate ligase [Rhodocyclaceae bacterium]|nr:nitroreductase family protein [Zoogloeaceae bacterium]MBV6406880.1 Coenzyme F420:L-glutamate ligase [Rhodocyclaceae bacterium]MCK6384826.1 nitroreductase family protein [Rhodocyclaceae bacterium]CAG0933447.1 3-hydroxypropanoate dehydrogenase [Rhodocyclaceae bacterium]